MIRCGLWQYVHSMLCISMIFGHLLSEMVTARCTADSRTDIEGMCTPPDSICCQLRVRRNCCRQKTTLGRLAAYIMCEFTVQGRACFSGIFSCSKFTPDRVLALTHLCCCSADAMAPTWQRTRNRCTCLPEVPALLAGGGVRALPSMLPSH